MTKLEAEDDQLALLTYDASREDERELVRAVAAATTLALENDSLETQLRANVEQLRASRTRIVESGDEARRRLERDLHGLSDRVAALDGDLGLHSPLGEGTKLRARMPCG